MVHLIIQWPYFTPFLINNLIFHLSYIYLTFTILAYTLFKYSSIYLLSI